MSNHLLGIKAAIYEMSLLFNQQVNDEKISAYAKALAQYTPTQIIYSFTQVINSGTSFFPSLAEILKHLKPAEPKKEDLAPVIANEIIEAIHHFAPDFELELLESVSENARLAIMANGGTRSIRDSENFETMKAQLERLIKGVLSSKEAGKVNDQLHRIGVDTSRILPFSDRLTPMRKIDFNSEVK